MGVPTPAEIEAGVPAGANIVQRIAGPNGQGTYVLDDQGGIYTMGGAQFFGSYWSPEMEEHRNDPERRFSAITLESGGYRILSNTPGELGYWFGPAGGTTTDTGTGTGDTADTETPEEEATRKSARTEVESLATKYGLDPAFVDRMWNVWLNTKDINKVYADMISDPAYKARFPGMDGLRSKGRIISEDQYLAQESQIAGIMRRYLPPGFYDDPTDYAAFIAGEVSPKEIEDRVIMAAGAASQASPEVRSELRRLYNIGDEDLTAFFLDPGKAMELITKQYTAGQISGAAVATGFGGLSVSEAEGLGLGGRNLSAEQATAGFERVAMLEPLFAETLDETTDLGRTEQLGIVGNDVQAVKQVERRKQSRAARFEGGGGAAGFGQRGGGLSST